jgi:hypothetical protein
MYNGRRSLRGERADGSVLNGAHNRPTSIHRQASIAPLEGKGKQQRPTQENLGDGCCGRDPHPSACLKKGKVISNAPPHSIIPSHPIHHLVIVTIPTAPTVSTLDL